MMYYKISDFLNDWEYEKGATLKLLGTLTDKSLNQKVSSHGRSLGQLAWHITASIGEMMSKTGLGITAPDDNSDAPDSAGIIKSVYDSVSSLLENEIKSKWNDDTLITEDAMYGQKWKRGATLSILITHQIHHRGQMTVLMRQAGIKVPGIYGPAYEEWAVMGMEPKK
jgi:uncharacterized damage-inducible protein DinB